MCAKKLSSEEVERRTEGLDQLIGDPEYTDEETVRVLRAMMSWKEWLRYDFSRYWYFIGCAALNLFLCSEIAKGTNGDPGVIASIIFLFILMSLVEYFGYRHFWPGGILTGRQGNEPEK
jgi:hypothetical protein